MKILVLNGPNLNMLGMREEDIYGSETLDDIEAKLKNKADSNECEVYFYQSNAEHELIDAIHTAFENGTDSIIFNPAGYTHTSVALRDAILAVKIPFYEVVSNNYIQDVHYFRNELEKLRSKSNFISTKEYYPTFQYLNRKIEFYLEVTIGTLILIISTSRQ